MFFQRPFTIKNGQKNAENSRFAGQKPHKTAVLKKY